jgi:hypothetical protein
MSNSIQDILFKIEEERRRKKLEEELWLEELRRKQKEEYLKRLQFPLRNIVAQNFSPLSIPISTGGTTALRRRIVVLPTGQILDKPIGAVDGSNKVFILSLVPDPGSAHIYVNGLLQFIVLNYDINGQILTFNIAPPAGAKLQILYRIDL